MTTRLRRAGALAVVFAPLAFSLASCAGDGGAPARRDVGRQSQSVWAEQAKLVALDGAANDSLGFSVAFDGSTIVAGAYVDDDCGTDAGSAYVFVRGASGWSQQAKLLGVDSSPSDNFGFSVALSGDRALVGAPSHDGSGSNSGAGYVFARSGSAWTEQQKLFPATADDALGVSVDIEGSSLLLGAPAANVGTSNNGAAWVFVHSGTSFNQQAKLQASDAAAGDDLGRSVSLSGDSALVGAPGDDDRGTSAGGGLRFRAFRRDLDPAAEARGLGRCGEHDQFGYPVAMSGRYRSDRGLCRRYLDAGDRVRRTFSHVAGTTWTEQQKLVGRRLDRRRLVRLFGGAVRDRPWSGAIVKRPAATGPAYVFGRTGATFGELAKLAGNGASSDARLGRSVALVGDSVVTGAMGDDSAASNAGAAYVFVSSGGPCSTTAQCSTGFCADGVCCATACRGACQACSAAKKASGPDGECGPVPSGFDPDNDCQPGYACVSGACATSCTNNGSCEASHYCHAATSTCRPDESNGTGCSSPTQCQSGFCVDGVCCDSSCSGVCAACTAAKKRAGQDGVCGTVAADTDPDNDCAASTVLCGADGLCDGNGVCRSYAKPGTPCGAVQCQGTLVTGETCDGVGVCTPNGPSQECVPFLCQNGRCTTSCTNDTECAASGFCNAGSCASKLTTGGACNRREQCQSGLCVDQRCCNTECSSQCEACDVAGTEGTCVAVRGSPHGTRAPCANGTAEEPCRAASCDGIDRTQCVLVGADVSCRASSCSAGTATRAAGCDGKGSCGPIKTDLCEPYVCAGDSCGSGDCRSDADCAERFRCHPTERDCVPDTATCDGDHTLTLVDGTLKDCAPFRCTTEGTCQETCWSERRLHLDPPLLGQSAMRRVQGAELSRGFGLRLSRRR